MKTGMSFDWRPIIFRGIESEELDYKAAQNWNNLTRAGKARFARHCMAMANTKGGYIVVGVGEDKSGRPCLYTGLNDRQCRSFDPTDVGNVINRFSDPQIDFDVERPVIDGRRYVVFVIRRFSEIPHVCSVSCNSELQQGVFYIRTADASSRPAFKASEIHGIVQRALRNQRELLGRMLRGILYEGRKTLAPEAKSEFKEQMNHSYRIFDKRKGEFSPENGTLWELSVFPSEFIMEKFALSEIQRAVDNSISTTLESSFIFLEESEDSYFTNVAFRTFSRERKQYWQAFSSGLFHYVTVLDKDKNSLRYEDVIRFVSSAVHFLGQYYYELGCTDELLSLKFKISSVEKVRLSGTGGKSSDAAYTCRIPEIEVKLQRTASDLMSGTVGHSARIIREICERFNLPQGKHVNLEKLLTDFLETRNI
ncbi:MAG TPA: hypothetical protein DET40_20385 [Lentisphaeria bacterium]|nr:MAG: hypothetical protein A2X45_16380 [Lentisphaerae bacterium GWF2_50_93]HCE45910.1 hypothetical protein [Lentisphaeria bacterium]